MTQGIIIILKFCYALILVTATITSANTAADESDGQSNNLSYPAPSLGTYRDKLSHRGLTDLYIKGFYPGRIVGASLAYINKDKKIHKYNVQHIHTTSGYSYKLHAILLSPPQNHEQQFSSPGCLIWFHRSTDNVSETLDTAARLGKKTGLRDAGWQILIPEYPGYTEEDFKEHLAPELEEMVHRWHIWAKDQHFNSENIVLIGHDIGSLVATYWARLYGASSLIVVSPYMNLVHYHSHCYEYGCVVSCLAKSIAKYTLQGYLDVRSLLSELCLPSLVIASGKCILSEQLAQDFYDTLRMEKKIFKLIDSDRQLITNNDDFYLTCDKWLKKHTLKWL